MQRIWKNDGSGWRLLESVPFPDERSLHGLVHEAPHVLPLSGTPRLVVVGREVYLGANRADLIAIEPSGRLALIEVKLSNNSEARRAIVAQVLTYAAYLHGLDCETLEQKVLRQHLDDLEYRDLFEAVQEIDEEAALERDQFRNDVTTWLKKGSFRLVLVLDQAPQELVRLVGYLETAANLVIDLVTVAAYDVNGERILVPQRIDSESEIAEPATRPRAAISSDAAYSPGADEFSLSIEKAASQDQPMLRRLRDWAVSLEKEGTASLQSYQGKGRNLLLVHVRGVDAGLVTLWNDRGPAVQVWRSVFRRLAPDFIERAEGLLLPSSLGQGNSIRRISDDLIQLLTDAYRVARSRSSAPSVPAASPSLHPGDGKIVTQGS